MHYDIADRIKGVFFGQAIGDALGLGTEFLSKKEVQEHYPNGLTSYSQIIQDRHRIRWQRGSWTDDTDMMLCILRSIIENKGELVPLNIAQKFKEWFNDKPMGIGSNTYKVLAIGDYTEKPFEAAELIWRLSGRKSAANGGVMRTSIIGLCRKNVISSAEDVCRLTHADPRCVGSCVIVSWIIHNLVYLKTMPTQDELLSMANAYDKRISDYLKMAIDGSLDDLELDDYYTMGYTLKTLAAALWPLYHCDSFEEGLLTVVNAGGDADTNAAVACCLLGAKYGYSSIPYKYVESLINKDFLMELVNNFMRVGGISNMSEGATSS